MHVGDGKSAQCGSNSFLNMFRRKKPVTGNANSNGKSVSWSESGPRHPPKGGSVWHRLSVHVRKQEANQTAVIRPLTNTPDPHSCDPTTTHAANATSCDQGVDNPPEDLPVVTGGGGAQKPQQDSANRPFWSPGDGLVDTHISHAPSPNNRPAIETATSPDPLSLTPSRLPLEEDRDLLQSYVYKGQGRREEDEPEPGEEDVLLQHKAAVEDPLALSPPSPFRDSVCSGESGSGSPSSSIYSADILRDFAHSSSTL